MRTKKIILVFVVVILLTGCGRSTPSPTAALPEPTPTEPQPTATVTPTPEPFKATFERGNCPFNLPSGAVEGDDVKCGYVTVPEEHAHTDGPTIRLAVAVIMSLGDDPVPDPLVIEAGGPGVSTLVAAPGLLTSAFYDFRAQRDIVLVEQRGTTYSDPALTCEEIDEADRQIIAEELTAEEQGEIGMASRAACRDRLTESGVNLSAYDSLENAADIPMVLTALGYDQFNFYGISYATMLGQHLMRDFPDRLRSVILDGVIPLSLNYMYYTPRATDHAFRQLFESCAADPLCNEAYPDLETVFFDLVDEFNQNPVPLTLDLPNVDEPVEIGVTGAHLVSQLYQRLYNTSAIYLLPAEIYALAEGDTTFIEGLGSFNIGSDLHSQGMYYSVLCSEVLNHPQVEIGYEGLYPQVVTTLAPQDDALGEICEAWDVEPLEEYVYEPVVSEIPTLLMSGQFDPITPAFNADRVAETLNASYAYTFPGVGHGSFSSSECSLSIGLAFLNDPTQEPEAGCIAEMDLAFVVLGEEGMTIEMEPFTDETLGLTGLRPSGWTESGPGVFARASSALDSTGVVIEVVPMSLEDLLELFAGQLGLDAPPDSAAQREANGLTWYLYSVEVQGIAVEFALAEHGEVTILILLQCNPAERDALYEAVFLPMVDALTPLE